MMNLSDINNIELTKLNGEKVAISDYADKVLLIVNTASKCGFTPQYEGLEELHNLFKDKGLVVLGFPCNQFGTQEPGSSEEIQSFCKINYGVSFPIFEKIDVNGDNVHPLFAILKEAAPGLLGSTSVKWNFTKFLVSRDRSMVIRYAPATKPHKLVEDIKNML
jgi:glutathione peroxidase